jgi:hypothetical protein
MIYPLTASVPSNRNTMAKESLAVRDMRASNRFRITPKSGRRVSPCLLWCGVKVEKLLRGE